MLSLLHLIRGDPGASLLLNSISMFELVDLTSGTCLSIDKHNWSD